MEGNFVTQLVDSYVGLAEAFEYVEKDDLVWNYYIKPVTKTVVKYTPGLNDMVKDAFEAAGSRDDINWNDVIWNGAKVVTIVAAPGVAASYFVLKKFTVTGVSVGAVVPMLPFAYYAWKIRSKMMNKNNR